MEADRGGLPPSVSAPGTERTALREALETAAVAVTVALLAWIPEWRTPGFYFHDDMQTQYVPAMLELGRAARQGRVALLSEYSWFGGALAGEYQHGVFSLVHVLLCACIAGLSLHGIARIVSVAYYALAGAGAYRAARVLDFSKPLALAVALVAALNGFNVIWGSWLPAITGWAWLMWLWWCLERLRRRSRPRWMDIAAAAFATYSVLAAGWHFADLLIMPLVASVLARRPRWVSFRDAFGRFGLGPLLGACLALPALLCFLEFARAGGRSDFDAVSWIWTVPRPAIKGLLVPLSTSQWAAFDKEALESNVVMAGGVLPVVVVLVALAAPFGVARRAYAWLLVAAGCVLVWCMLPSLGRVRWPFRWLPVFHLLVVLAAATVVARQYENGRCESRFERVGRLFRQQLIVASIGTVLIAAVLVFATAEPNAIPGVALGLVGLWGLPIAARLRADIRIAFCAGIALNLLAAPLGFSDRAATPNWPSDHCETSWARVDHAVRYLGVYHYSDIVDPAEPSVGRGACVLPGNASMVEGLTFVNGYSTLFVAGLHRHLGLEVHGDLSTEGLAAVTGPLASRGGLLERWGLDRLVVPSDPFLRTVEGRLKSSGFAPVDDLNGARIWRRPLASTKPLLEGIDAVDVGSASMSTAGDLPLPSSDDWTFDSPLGTAPTAARHVELTKLGVVMNHATPTRVEASVQVPSGSSTRPGLVLLRRPWLPGYRAALAGAPVAVGRLDDTLVGVVIPAGASGRLLIEYVPLGVRAPALLAVVAALVVLAAGFVWEFLAPRRRGVSDDRGYNG